MEEPTLSADATLPERDEPGHITTMRHVQEAMQQILQQDAYLKSLAVVFAWEIDSPGLPSHMLFTRNNLSPAEAAELGRAATGLAIRMLGRISEVLKAADDRMAEKAAELKQLTEQIAAVRNQT
jgi:hypothetical protein